MPRDSNGLYSLPAGNPVVTATVISSTWANTTLEDLADAMTDSLSRSGDGGMTAPLELDNGAVGAPGLTWSSETTSGLYRAGVGDFRYSISSTMHVQLTASLFKLVLPELELEDAAPIIHIDETDAAANERNWLIRSASGILSLSTASDAAPTTAVANALTIDRSGTTATIAIFGGTQFQYPDGLVGTPIVSFSGDIDTGFYRIGADQFGASCGNLLIAEFLNNGGNAQFRIADGSASFPSAAFSQDADTGLYRLGANQFGASSGGVLIAEFLNNGGNPQFRVPAGSASFPSIAFNNDGDTGIYRAGADTINIAAGGASRLQIGTGAVLISTALLNFDSGYTTSATASAGAATLPANPTGFLVITLAGGTQKIPYYNS